MSTSSQRSTFALAVVGAGIIGLAVARKAQRRLPHGRVIVLEAEDRIAAHQTSHNSGVIHAGIYYAPGSLKAKLCVEGAAAMYDYCDRQGIAYERCGKLVVALDSRELPKLDELERRGRANGVCGLRRIEAAEIAELEPHLRGAAALHSPATGIVDFAQVAQALADELRSDGGEIATGCRVRRIEERERELRIGHGKGITTARSAISCCGAWSDEVAKLCGGSADPRIVPFRGAYLRLKPQRSELVRSLVYPVPDPSLPFLGVHLTRQIDGGVLVGPTALLVGARDAYRPWRARPSDLARTLTWPGSWRMAARYWRTGLHELRIAASRRALVAAASRYVPELRADDVVPGFAGIRAQAVDRRGNLVDDFVFSGTRRTLHVRNAPSPGATSSLAIARAVVERARRELDLGLRP